MLVNKKLKLNLPGVTGIMNDSPNTPTEQISTTPIMAPIGTMGATGAIGATFNHSSSSSSSSGSTSYFNSLYSHANESDDIIVDGSKSYSINFNPEFDQLVMSIYGQIKSLPTTTPFSGHIPPSGLASRVARETLNTMLQSNIIYDEGKLILQYGKNQSYYPIFLQLIRKRLLDLCNNNPDHETSIIIDSKGSINQLRQTSISNLSLNELNINNYAKSDKDEKDLKSGCLSINNNNSNNNNCFDRPSLSDFQRKNSNSDVRNNLRKHSLTRNNSYSNSWLHIGNLANIKPQHMNSTESLQDFVPLSFINRSAVNDNSRERSNSVKSTSNSIEKNDHKFHIGVDYLPRSNDSSQYNHSSFDYQTPPSSQKSSNQFTPSDLNRNNDFDDFQFLHDLPPPGVVLNNNNNNNKNNNNNNKNNIQKQKLTINTDHANIIAINTLNGFDHDNSNNNNNNNNNTDTRHNTRFSGSLDSPFMSASADDSYFTNGFPTINSANPSPSKDDFVDKINSSNYTLNEKKRDSLKMKRGIH